MPQYKPQCVPYNLNITITYRVISVYESSLLSSLSLPNEWKHETVIVENITVYDENLPSTFGISISSFDTRVPIFQKINRHLVGEDNY